MTERYRKGVGIFLINKNNEIWVGKRLDFKNKYWQMPQGGIDKLESPEVAMRRELMEETGLSDNYKVICRTKKWLEYRLPENQIHKVWNGKYVGQKQLWFACRFLGNDNDINLNKFEKPEFCEWRWIKPSDCLKHVVPFKKEMYNNIFQEFSGLLN